MYPVIQFFNYSIPTFGVLFLLGTGAAFLLGVQAARKYGISTMDSMFFGLFGIIGGIIGAKLLYIIVDLPNLIASPETALIRLATGGAVFYGGLFGGIFLHPYLSP
jgi:phosphatidylglycerol:prolipoprotein diacylglycerol transferase